MPAKKDTTAAPKKAAAATSTHGSYKDMIKEAIIALKDRTGSSRQAIAKYVVANNKLGNATDAAIRQHINKAIASGVTTGDFTQPKGTSGPVKLAKKEAAPKKTAAAPKAKTETKVEAPAKKTKTAAATKKTAAAPKKAAPAKKAAAPKAAPKAKANTAKARKPAAKKADAVVAEKPKTLTKTKSGRVSKGTGAGLKKDTVKKAAAKKASPAKKAATPKKSPAKAAA